MSTKTEFHVYALQPFVPHPDAIVPLDTAAHLARMPRHLVLVCCKRSLVTPSIDPNYGGYFFDATAIRTLQRITYLHRECGINLTGIRIILQLMDELGRLRISNGDLSQGGPRETDSTVPCDATAREPGFHSPRGTKDGLRGPHSTCREAPTAPLRRD